MARTKSAPKKEPIWVRSLALTEATQDTLARLSREASDELGWTVSMSAVARALLRCVEQQPASWAKERLFPLIEREIAGGTVWGTKK